MIKLCIFDIDGTILDTLGQIEYYVNRALTAYSLPNVPREKVREFVGYGARNLIKSTLTYVKCEKAEDSEFFEEFFKNYLDTFNSDVDYLVSVYPGIKDALSYIKSLGIKLAVLSNKPHSTTIPCINRFFGDIFDVVYGGRDGIPLKPDPTLPRLICEEMGVLPEETIFFGDSDVDMLTAKNYGAKVSAGVLWGFRDEEVLSRTGADVILKDTAEIIELVRSEVK